MATHPKWDHYGLPLHFRTAARKGTLACSEFTLSNSRHIFVLSNTPFICIVMLDMINFHKQDFKDNIIFSAQ